jgi:hypothetical protein
MNQTSKLDKIKVITKNFIEDQLFSLDNDLQHGPSYQQERLNCEGFPGLVFAGFNKRKYIRQPHLFSSIPDQTVHGKNLP